MGLLEDIRSLTASSFLLLSFSSIFERGVGGICVHELVHWLSTKGLSTFWMIDVHLGLLDQYTSPAYSSFFKLCYY
jgi:hypothetical protein